MSKQLLGFISRNHLGTIPTREKEQTAFMLTIRKKRLHETYLPKTLKHQETLMKSTGTAGARLSHTHPNNHKQTESIRINIPLQDKAQCVN